MSYLSRSRMVSIDASNAGCCNNILRLLSHFAFKRAQSVSKCDSSNAPVAETNPLELTQRANHVLGSIMSLAQSHIPVRI